MYKFKKISITVAKKGNIKGSMEGEMIDSEQRKIKDQKQSDKGNHTGFGQRLHTFTTYK